MGYFQRHKVLIRYISEHLTRSQFLILSGILVGLSAGTAAIILKTAVHHINLLTTEQRHFFNYPYFNLFLPLLGLLLTVWVVNTFLRKKTGAE